MPIQHHFKQGNERTSLLRHGDSELRTGRFRAIERRSSALLERFRSVSDASLEDGIGNFTSWLTRPSRTIVTRVMKSFWHRLFVLQLFPCALVLIWCSIPFRLRCKDTMVFSGPSAEIYFWFFLFVYYGFYNVIGLLWMTKLFNLYSLNWWPQSLGGTVSYFFFWFLSVLLGGTVYLCSGLERYTLTWVALTFVTMLCPVVAAFTMLLRARRFAIRGVTTSENLFQEIESAQGVPASYVRFLWFCLALVLALVTFLLGETYAWVYFSTLPHSNIDALLYVYSWVGTIHLLDGVTGWILSSRVENYPLASAFKYYYSLTYQVYVRNLYARLRSPEQFLVVQLASFIGVVIISPLQMTSFAQKVMVVLTNSTTSLTEYRKLMGRTIYLRHLAENVTMIAFLGWISILHFGPNRHVYPFFSFEDKSDPYNFKLTFVASLIIWVSELASAFIIRLISKKIFKHDVTQEAIKDFERYPDLLPCAM